MRETWAGIVRVSSMGTRKANADDFHADDDQVEAIQRYAAAHSAKVVMLPPELDKSGGLPIAQRPSLLAAIEGVEAGEYDGIVVAYLTRLTRSRSGQEIWERVEAAGGHVHCARESLDTSTANGRFIRDIHLANAVREREEHAEQHAERRRKTVERGIWKQRQTPTGYRRGEKPNRCLLPDERADDVRWAFRAKASGTPVVTIASRLGMTPSGARQMLRNRVYLGELRDGEHVNPTAHEPLVTVEEFEAAQGRQPRATRSSRPVALLSGVVRCATCGHLMTRGATRAVVYRCPTLHSGQRCPVPAAVTEASLDAHVEAIVRAELRKIDAQAAVNESPVDDARQALESAEREQIAYVEAVSAAEIGAQAFAAGAKVRAERVEAAREALRTALARDTAGFHRTGDVAWDRLPAEGRNAVVRAMLAAVVVRPAGRGRRVSLSERVRVIARDADLGLPVRRGERAFGIVPPRFPDADDPRVLGLVEGEQAA